MKKLIVSININIYQYFTFWQILQWYYFIGCIRINYMLNKIN